MFTCGPQVTKLVPTPGQNAYLQVYKAVVEQQKRVSRGKSSSARQQQRMFPAVAHQTSVGRLQRFLMSNTASARTTDECFTNTELQCKLSREQLHSLRTRILIGAVCQYARVFSASSCPTLIFCFILCQLWANRFSRAYSWVYCTKEKYKPP